MNLFTVSCFTSNVYNDFFVLFHVFQAQRSFSLLCHINYLFHETVWVQPHLVVRAEINSILIWLNGVFEVNK